MPQHDPDSPILPAGDENAEWTQDEDGNSDAFIQYAIEAGLISYVGASEHQIDGGAEALTRPGVAMEPLALGTIEEEPESSE